MSATTETGNGEQVHCRSCGSPDIECVGPLAPGVDFAGITLKEPLPGGNLFRCASCSLTFRHPTLSKERLDELYRSGTADAWAYDTEERRADWAIVQDWMEKHFGGGSVLDVGCYDGSFLQRLGDHWSLYGIEMNEEAIRRSEARGIEIIGSDATTPNLPSRRFDMVVAFDLAEHVHDPRTLVAEMAAATRVGGAVAIGTGDSESFAWRMMGSRYRYCTLPEHISFINRTWCEKTADHLGLELVLVARYSHAADRPVRLVAAEALKNFAFRFFPRSFARLRSLGLGGIDAAQHTEWAMVPPVWTTARDHILAIFQVP